MTFSDIYTWTLLGLMASATTSLSVVLLLDLHRDWKCRRKNRDQ